ncbi:MAG: hypothetical protein ABIL22_01040 [candidate division WOR-3 bacterium]
MNRIYRTLFGLLVFVSMVLAGPPPDAGMGTEPGVKPAQKMLRWFGLEYGWYAPSLKDLNNQFSGPLGGEKIGINDYIAIGIGMPTPGDNRVGLFFGYWNCSAKQGSSKLNVNMIFFSPEMAFRIVKIPNKVLFSLGLIMRDVFSWWKFESVGADTSEMSLVTDFGAKVTTEYYPTKSIGIKFDFGRIIWGFDWTNLLGEENTRMQTPGFIMKFGLNFYY